MVVGGDGTKSLAKVYDGKDFPKQEIEGPE
jgi:hypothetical protein